jgi:hypothetical protein
MAYNRYLDEFLMFYSQSERGNGLTRGLDTALARRTYVDTKLDRVLADAILANHFRLVVLTGNAGDGKTSFIQKIEEAAQKQGAQIEKRETLGASFQLNGRKYETLYDGSVDANPHTGNHELLQDFFKPFEGDKPPKDDTCKVIALNEGKLREFFSQSTKHPWLSAVLLNHLQDQKPLPNDTALVNLNLRSVVDAEEQLTNCLFDRVMDRFVAPEFWQACETCPARYRCPVKFNVDTLRVVPTDTLSGKEKESAEAFNSQARRVRTRLKALFQVLHFRKRIHLTVRDLRSVLTFALFGKKTCAQLEQEMQEGVDFGDRYYYNAVFNGTEKDRVLSYLHEFDIGRASNPRIDSELSFASPRQPEFRRFFFDFHDPVDPSRSRSRTDEDDLTKLYNQRPQSPDDRTPEALKVSQDYVASLRRKLFFEGINAGGTGSNDTVLHSLIPYDNVPAFLEFVRTGRDNQETLKRDIILAISRSESILEEGHGSENICIRTRHAPGAEVKSFYAYPASHFKLVLPDPGPQTQFIEFLPSSILMKHHSGAIVLEITLDLYETLMRIRDGYVPAAGEMRAFFLNLLMFKKQLMALPADRLLLTEDNYELLQLRRTPNNKLELSRV